MAIQPEKLTSMHPISRRDFVRLGAGTVAAGAAMKATLLHPASLATETAPGEPVRFVSIGTGIRGCELLRSARKVPSGVCVGTADLYEMHRKAGLEAWGYVKIPICNIGTE